MKINIKDLLDIIHVLENRMKEVYPGGVIDIPDDDYYWSIADDKKYNPAEIPIDFDLGQVSFDWDELIKLKEEADKAGRFPISYHLGCIAEIFNVIKKNGSGVW